MAELLLRVDSARFNPIGPIERKALEAEIERLIELLDIVDGDCDLEDNGDREFVNEDGVDAITCKRLRYGDDQTKGPINQVEILRDHRRLVTTDPNYRRYSCT